MQKYPRLITYSFLDLKSLIRVSSLSKFERQFVTTSKIIRLKNGGKLSCELDIIQNLGDHKIAGLKFLIQLTDDLTLKISSLPPSTSFH
jgi:hypothetical protein